jgi:hypothetical protein
MILNIDCTSADRFMARYRDRYCYGDGGDPQTTASNTSVTQPWGPSQPFLTDLMSQAQGLNNAGGSYAPFSTVAPFSGATQQGLDMTQQRAMNGSPVTQAADSSLINLLQPRTAPGASTLNSLMQGYSDPGQATQQQWANPDNINPYLDGVFKSASRPVIDAVNGQFSMAGRTGSTANQNALTDRLGDLSSKIYGQGYDSAASRSLSAADTLSSNATQKAQLRGNFANLLNTDATAQDSRRIAAAAAAPGLAASDYNDLSQLRGVGDAYDTQAGNYIQDALNRWNFSQNNPWDLLNKYRGVISGLGNLGGTTSGTSSGTAPQPSMIPNLLASGVNILGADSSKGGGSIFANLLGL